ncbi:dTDP-4-dehydrorhamnose reductase [Sphingobium yanoikuyae]|jgi:dTDP-4-dehydrorhamnose reductase|uniref:dTDP-4-dehydrorhamnose reductase n=1 Tax=Sphingobium yanoikuyae TaxID=13690 RepID=A0A0J9CV22_SPHYA|nr:dTDP-4-dehydrorhamnose reductase [Sphingobium yanoikuyae]ATP17598.1 NAD(P)-dependent oxidoreductase [Sphingobium yanoikuyae]KMW28694.1 dTDP-4-dehydrorhamnose reductase [Sphingobium yanoikuyae]
MKALIVGGGGQLGRSLNASAPLTASVISLDRAGLDITDAQAIQAVMQQERPDIIFNAAAYTAVDRAESDAEAAMAANATAVGYMAEAAQQAGAAFVHVSTDFVFDGAAGTPYPTDAATSPLGVYGATKLEGERLAGADALIVRTAWVYAPTGGNFVRTMLRLMSERSEVRVVADQIGTPTYAPALADALWAMSQTGAKGIYHYTDAGVASWYDFAVAIQEEALEAGLLTEKVPVIPIATSDFPTAAERPGYSVLDKSATYALIGKIAPHWRDNLRIMLKEIKTHG